MNQAIVKRIMIRHALCWMTAVMTPVGVMIVLDLFEFHTPARVALVSGISLLAPFTISNQLLGRELGRLVPKDKDQA